MPRQRKAVIERQTDRERERDRGHRQETGDIDKRQETGHKKDDTGHKAHDT